ncbi:MAG: hypothetical protein JJU00_10600 [Opitutales bacterium]|nr:hypothetical protein [Opitutales bacterium]
MVRRVHALYGSAKAMWFNKTYDTVGTLWVERFRSVLVPDTPWLVGLVAALSRLRKSPGARPVEVLKDTILAVAGSRAGIALPKAE